MASVTVPGFGALKTVLEGLKSAGTVLREADKIPQYEAVNNAYIQIAQMQGTIHELQEKLRESEKELKQMREAQASAVGSVRWADHLWLYRDDSPCCLYCWEKQKRLFHVIPIYGKGIFRETKCPECETRIERVPRRSYWQMESEKHLEAVELQSD
jgi:hypothetical protein